MRAWLCLLFAIASLPSTATDIAEGDERRRRLSLIFATEHSSFFCETPYKVLSAGEADAAFQSGRSMAWTPLIASDQMFAGRACARDAAKLPACTGLSGTECCLRVDAGARAAFNDLHNWAPVEKAFHARRGPAVLGGEQGGGESLCGGSLSASNYLPAESRRGDVARLLLYYERTHGMGLDEAARRRLIDWDMRDPVDAVEAARAQRIDIVQGTEFAAPRRTLEVIEKDRREWVKQARARDSSPINKDLAKKDYWAAYFPLRFELGPRLEAAAIDILDRRPGAWDRAFEILDVHDAAVRAVRPGPGGDLYDLESKLLALAIASGNDGVARSQAEWFVRLGPPGTPHEDAAYPAFILQMADVVLSGRWPAESELRQELGPYRGLFLPAGDSGAWHRAMNAAANHYLEAESWRWGPRLFAVEFTALTRLRKQYASRQYSEPVHALQLLETARVPAYRKGTSTAALQKIRLGFAAAPASPPLHRAILDNDEVAFRAALPGANLNQEDHLGQTPLLLAALWHREKMLPALRDAGANLPANAGRFLEGAAGSGMRTTVELLLAAGAPPNYLNPMSQEGGLMSTALRSEVDTVAIVKLLLDRGARPDKTQERWHDWVWRAARTSNPEDFIPLIRLFQRAGMDVKNAGILCAAMQEPRESGRFEAALGLGASVNEGAESGSAPIFCAIDARNLSGLKALVAAGARLNVRNEAGLSPRAYAVDQGMDFLARYLRQAEADSRPAAGQGNQ